MNGSPGLKKICVFCDERPAEANGDFCAVCEGSLSVALVSAQGGRPPASEGLKAAATICGDPAADLNRADDFKRASISVNEEKLLRAAIVQFTQRLADLEADLNRPVTADFMRGIPLEAAHQRMRWGSKHDQGKQPLDWFWLIGYLAQKAATSALGGDLEKARHHTISTAAALANWHLQLSGANNAMRPRIANPEAPAS